MNDRRLDADEVARFQSDGYLLMPALFDAEEVALMRQALASDEGIADRRNTMAMRDADGSVTTTMLWTEPGDDLFGAIARCERVVGGAERLLGGEVYHYHSKLTLKAPEDRRYLELASGLRLLVLQRQSVPRHAQRLHRHRPGDGGERVPPGHPRLIPHGPTRHELVGGQLTPSRSGSPMP